MPRKSAAKPAEEKNDSRRKKKASEPEPDADVEAQAETAPEEAPKKKQAKPRAKKNNESKTSESKTTVESTSASDSTVTKTRHVPTRETVEKEFDELVACINEEIEKLRSSTAKSKGVKFLRTVNKRVKTLRNHALRVAKQRPTTRRSNTNSGFLKPVQISRDLAKFTGWDHSQLRSRVDVTKFICDYIKEHDLQDPADKRNIRVENDANLKKLLKYDAKDNKPLTYYSLQTYLKGHFTPAPASVPAGAQKEAPVAKEAPAKKNKA